MSRSLFLGCESLRPGNGGICRVARLMARVLLDESRAGALTARGAVLSDRVAPADLPLRIVPAGGSRLRFVAEAQRSAFRTDLYLYDFLGMARAHPRFPLPRRPFMTWIHGVEVWDGTPAHRIEWARRADFLLSNTEYTRDRAERAFGGFRRARVCWLATEEDDPPAVPARPETAPTVLILGRMESEGYKGHDLLIDAWPRVASAVRDARLLVVGRGPGLPALRERAAGSTAGNRIEFRGFVPEEEIDGIWAETSLLAMPSRNEGFGLVYVEGMRHGKPVIACKGEAGAEINIDGVTGFNVDPARPGDLSERIIELLEDPARTRAMGEAGRRRWMENFRYGAFRRRFVPLLREFLG